MKKFSSDHDLNALANEAEEAGWRISKTNKGHLKWMPPEGMGTKLFYSATTPRSKRIVDHVKLQMRRAMGGDDLGGYLEKIKQKRTEQKMSGPVLPLTQKLQIPLPKPREDLHIRSARKMVLDLVAQGKPLQDSVTVIMQTFRVTQGTGADVTREGFMQICANPTWGQMPTRAPAPTRAAEVEDPDFDEPQEVRPRVEPKAPAEEPKRIVKKARAPAVDIDDQIRHIRAIIDMPFDKGKKLEIIIDLLDKIL